MWNVLIKDDDENQLQLAKVFPCHHFALYCNEFPNIEHKNTLLNNIMHHLYTNRQLIQVGSCGNYLNMVFKILWHTKIPHNVPMASGLITTDVLE